MLGCSVATWRPIRIRIFKSGFASSMVRVQGSLLKSRVGGFVTVVITARFRNCL
jgi:hypothetical protein